MCIYIYIYIYIFIYIYIYIAYNKARERLAKAAANVTRELNRSRREKGEPARVSRAETICCRIQRSATAVISGDPARHLLLESLRTSLHSWLRPPVGRPSNVFAAGAAPLCDGSAEDLVEIVVRSREIPRRRCRELHFWLRRRSR